MKGDTTLFNLLRGCGVQPRNYGYAKLSTLFEAIDVFEIQRRKQAVYVRIKPKPSPKKPNARPPAAMWP